MEDPPTKRQRVNYCRGNDDYLPGNILEIELHNFMTYDYLSCEPAPRLNLVIGPNGSGKSSIVCAIALGLGGDPQILGRAASIGAFVKRGEDSGYVKISLRGHTAKDKIVITRKIDTQNKSEWVLNGVSVPKRDVVEIIHKFNIQVNNLTQFLPQDRVCEFAKLSPIQLLEETEKAVGDPELPVQHQKLIEKSRELKKLEMTVKQNKESLDQLKALNADLERDVERVRQRQQLLEKVELMKKKLPWLKYDMKRSEYQEAQRMQNEAKKRLNGAAKILNGLSVPLKKKRQLKSEQDVASKKISNRIHQNSKNIMELIDFQGDLGAQVKAKYAEIEDLRKQDDSRQQNLAKAVEELKAAETELANLPHYEPPKDALEKLNREIMKLELEANQRKLLKSEKESLSYQKKGSLRQCSNRLKEFENKNMKLLEALRNSGADKIIDAYHWLQSHRSEFNKDVYGPVLLEVNVNDQTHASYLEDHVPYYIWKAVVCQDPRDRDFLVRNLKSFDVPVLNYVNDGPYKKMTLEIPSQLRELGIYSRLDQVFDAPDAVQEILTSQTSIASSYIGTHETDRKADKLSKFGILDFWTPESHYRWTISRYGGHASASVEPVRPSRLFLYSTDSQDIERYRSRKKELEDEIADLDESIQALQHEQRQFEDSAAILQKEHEEIMNTVRLEKKKHRELESRIDLRRRRVESLRAEVDVESNCRKLLDKVSQLNGRRFDVVTQIKNLLINAVSQKWSYVGKHMSSIEIDMQISALEVDFKQHEKAALLATTHFENCKETTDTCRQQLSAAKREAEAVAIITEELAQEFDEMPKTIEELDAAIQDTISQANSILFVNQNILQEYEARKNKIDAISMKLESDVQELQKCSLEINNLKDKWLPTLRNLVRKIDETFSRNFKEMAIAGEVSLDERDMDFDQYGVLIKVKFRETGQLQVLSAHHQSGGERSVSTILYLVSLQDLTNCPFRVVDEINQGMDLVNERKMFQQLVRAASQRSTPQCFLLTPKLLDNLDYSEACSILNIMNGPWIKQASEVWKHGQSWRAITGLETRG